MYIFFLTFYMSAGVTPARPIAVVNGSSEA